MPGDPAQADDRSARKFALYTQASAHLAQGGLPGIGARFLADPAAFLAAGCRNGRVCPTNPEGVALADRLALMAVP